MIEAFVLCFACKNRAKKHSIPKTYKGYAARNKKTIEFYIIDSQRVFMDTGSIKNITKEDIELFLSDTAFSLKTTQLKLCVPIINRLYKKMKTGIYFTPVKKDGILLCDGHHRYIASLLFSKEIESVPALAAPSVKAILWSDVVLDEEEWDTEAKVNMLNEQDALFNGIALQTLLALLR